MNGGRLLRMVAGATAAVIFYLAGAEMRDIESVAGTSIDEAFYQAFGMFAWGMAVLSIAVAPMGLSFGLNGMESDWQDRVTANFTPRCEATSETTDEPPTKQGGLLSSPGGGAYFAWGRIVRGASHP